ALDCKFTASSPLSSRSAARSAPSGPPPVRKAATPVRTSSSVRKATTPARASSSARKAAKPAHSSLEATLSALVAEIRSLPSGLVMPSADQFIFYALGASILVHAVLLAIQFRVFDPARLKDRMPPLEVALVNAKSKVKPAVADVLAQANLDGGGNTELPRRAKTPLPVVPKASATGDIAVASQRLDVLEQEARELMTRIKGTPPTTYAMPKPVEAPEPVAPPSATELMQRTLESMRIEARIAKDIENYQQRPKRRFVGARAEEYRLARYVEDWRA